MKKKIRTISFYEFFRIFVIQNKIQLKIRSFHKEVCDQLEKVVLTSSYEFVVINIPPRVGKTKMMEALCAWQLGHFPDSHIIYTSYGNELATASSRYILQTIQSTWFIHLFENLAGPVQQAANFNTKFGGVLRADGTGGTLTGFGAGLKSLASGFIVIDDPAKPNEALSQTVSQSIRTWLTNTLLSRRNSGNKTPIIICAQRLAEDDLCGHVLSQYPDSTLHLKFPAMIDDISIIDDTISTETLLSLKRVDPFTFASQYQQDPIVIGGNILKTEWLRYYDEDLVFDYKFFTLDTAQKTKEHNDSTVMSCWGVIGKDIYLEDCLIGKWEAPDLEKVAIEFYQRHRPRIVKVEMKSSGIGLCQAMKRKGFPMFEIERNIDKYTRCLNAAPFIALGIIHLRKNLIFLPYIIAETAGFRADLGHKHDDFCDTLFDAVDHLYGNEVSILDCL